MTDFLGESPFAGSQLELGAKERLPGQPTKDSFFANPSIEELAEAQNVGPLQTGAELATSIEEEPEDIDLMLDTIYRSRN